jgi:LacI family transcriptional regulator
MLSQQLKQIAKEPVSVSTVSKALNDSPEISDQTNKNQGICKVKNYKPNVIGLNLKTEN